MKMLMAAWLLLGSYCVSGQATDTIHLNFLYGSIPAKGYRNSEPKLFGGLKGGHVNIQANGKVLDFRPEGNCHIVPDNKKPNGGFYVSNNIYWDTATSKWLTIKIPVTASQLKLLDSLFHDYAKETPYDYAVFGMRCAAASYDVLSDAGLFKKMSYKNNILVHFYPKLLRKRMIRWAARNNYPVLTHEGKPSRKWETDEGIF